MDKIIKKTGLAVAVLMLLTFIWSCDKKWPMNGNLDGYWQFMTIETKKDKKIKNCFRMYMAIQLQMVELRDLGNNGYKNLIGEFSYDEDKNLVVIKNLKGKFSTSDDKQPASLEELNDYGLYSLENVFRIIKADGSNLILESDDAILTLRSF